MAVAWTLLAFGGAYPWTLIPLYVLTAVLLVIVRPALLGESVEIDVALMLALACAAFQLVPLAAGIRHALSPNADVLLAVLQPGPLAAVPRPLSIDPERTMTWLPSGAAAVVLFWCARASFSGGGVRRSIRAIAWIGLAVSVFAIVHRWSAPHLLYWHWQPLDAGGTTFGPFVNRNHMATWLLLALPTVTGYVATRAAARSNRADDVTAVVGSVEDATTVWLVASIAAMLAALIVSQSRSGIIGLAGGAAFGALVARAANQTVRRGWAAASIVVAVIVAGALTSTDTLVNRFVTTQTPEMGGREEIWKQTLPMVRDFAGTGVGIGAFGTAMLVYQTGNRLFFFNQAHDQYLQFAAEGGALVGLPVLAVIVCFGAAAARRLRGDRSPAFWMRLGAAAGLVAVGVQSFWETGLRMPANGVLCAVVAAIALRDHASRWE